VDKFGIQCPPSQKGALMNCAPCSVVRTDGEDRQWMSDAEKNSVPDRAIGTTTIQSGRAEEQYRGGSIGRNRATPTSGPRRPAIMDQSAAAGEHPVQPQREAAHATSRCASAPLARRLVHGLLTAKQTAWWLAITVGVPARWYGHCHIFSTNQVGIQHCSE